MKYLLDTNICIYAIKHRPPSVLKKLMSLNADDVAIASITNAELVYGAYKSQKVEQNLEAISLFLSPFTILDFGGSAVKSYGQIRSTLEKQGEIIGANDLIIAAQAMAQNYILVTNNEKEFSRINGLIVENWV